MNRNLQFGVSITTDRKTGAIISAYFQIRRGRVNESREFGEGNVIADYDEYGYLLGIEVLGPCNVTIVDQLAAHESAALRDRMKQFIKGAGPRDFIMAA